ncbi:hypothetical protein ZOSMA_6G00930 [Zostera marina]|uniref:Protein kinase domain-containing protein n=1 Tax=Zostera marina TaxID=29655 RepID=A0A0K9NT08_ZOSMR|nr:hypothetical protein ZOSMA_6G00930 [Zostera marina]
MPFRHKRQKKPTLGEFFSGHIPSEYGKWKFLEYLAVSENELGGFIPPEIGNLSLLQELYVGYYHVYSGCEHRTAPAPESCAAPRMVPDIGVLPNKYMENASVGRNCGAKIPYYPGSGFGSLYLHEEWEHVVIHRDVKASNVLLNSEMNGNSATLDWHGANPSTTRVVGTLGYLALETTRSGKATTMSDVFSFGALMLEVVCGQRPVEPKAPPMERR